MTNLQDILLLHPDEIEGNISIAESAYNMLSTVPLDNTFSIGNLDFNQIQILKVWQTVLRVKGEQAEVAMKEFLCNAKESDYKIQALTKLLVDKEEELHTKQKQMDEFNSNHNTQKFSHDDTPLEEDKKNNYFLVQMESLGAQLFSERKTNQHLNSELQLFKCDLNKAKEDLKSVHIECRNYKEQLQELKTGIVTQRNTEDDFKERLNSKTHDYSDLLDVNSDLKTNCIHLSNENEALKLEMQQAISELEGMVNLNKALQYRQSELVRDFENATVEKDNLLCQIRNLESTRNIGCDEQIFEVVDIKAKEWNSLLNEKESLLNSALHRIEILQSELGNKFDSSEPSLLDNLQACLSERDNRIVLLERELYDTLKDLENFRTRNSDGSFVAQFQTATLPDIIIRQDVGDQIDSEKELRLRAEYSASNKDELYARTLTELKKFESGDISLHDALLEIKHYKKQIMFRDEDIARLTSQLNYLDSKLSVISDENACLKCNIGIESTDFVHYRDEKAQNNELLSTKKDNFTDSVCTLKSCVLDQNDDTLLSPGLKNEHDTKFKQSDSDNICRILHDLTSQLHSLSKVPYEQHSFVFKQLNTSIEKLISLVEIKDTTNDEPNTIVLSLRSQVSQLQEQLSTKSSELGILKDAQNFGQVFANNSIAKDFQLDGHAINERICQNCRRNDEIEMMKPKSLYSLLYDHLLQVIAENIQLEDRIQKAYSEIVKYEKQLTTILQQLGFLYRDHFSNIEVWNSERREWLKERETFYLRNEKEQILLEEIIQLKKSLSEHPHEVRARFVDLLSRFSVLRYTEETLHRKYSIQKLNETGLKNEIARLTEEIKCIESTVTERICYLNRFKDAANFKIALLQSEVEESVSLSEHTQLNREYSSLCRKYELKIGCDTTYFTSEGSLDTLEFENSKLILYIEQQMKADNGNVKRATFPDDLLAQNGTKANNINDSNVSQSILSNEKQKADMYQLRLKQSKQMLTTVENRNKELEHNYSRITEDYLSLQESLLILKEEFSQSLTLEDAEALKLDMRDLEDKCADLTNESEKLKSLADISERQTSFLLQQMNTNDYELSAMRKQLINLQAESNQNLIIGKLHLEISHLKISEGVSLQTILKAKKHEQSLEANLLKLQKTSQQREKYYFRHKTALLKKIKRLQTYSQFLKRELSCSTPLIAKEKLVNSINNLNLKRNEANRIVKELKEVQYQIELKRDEYELQEKQMIELKQIKSEGNSSKIQDLHNRVRDYQLSELRLKRKLAKMKLELSEEKNLSQMNEQALITLEEELVAVVNEKETLQAEWDQRENELESIIQEIEHSKDKPIPPEVEELLVNALPNSNDPLHEQLDHSIQSVRRFGSLLVNMRVEKERIEKELHECVSQIHKTGGDLLIREREISELKLRIPEHYLDETQTTPERLVEYDNQLKLAQNTIQSLQNHITRNEETIEKYQEKLQDARIESEGLIESHRQELEDLSSKLYAQSDSNSKRLREFSNDAVPSTTQPIIPQNYLVKLKEMEELIQELEREKTLMIDESTSAKALLLDARDEQIRIKQVCSDEAEANTLKLTNEISKLTETIQLLEQKVVEKDLEIEVLEGEISATREATNQPLSRVMKDQVNRLKQNLIQKDNDIQTLEEALLQVKSELMDITERAVIQEARGAEHQHSLHAIVNERSSEYQEKLKKANLKNEELIKELSKKKEEATKLHGEISNLKRQLNKQCDSSVPVRESYDNDIKKLERELEQEKISTNKIISNVNRTRDVLKQENNELKNRNIRLEKENEQFKTNVKELESKGTVQNREEVSKWEEGKKWQKKFDTQKTLYSDKVRDFENAHKQIQSLKSLLEKSDRDKSISQNKLKHIGKPSLFPPIGEHKDKEIQELKSELFAMQNEKTILKRNLVLDRDIKLQELQNINDTLKFKLETLECKAEAPEEMMFVQNETIQNNLLECQKENIRLNFDIEQSQKEIPRLTGRITELESFSKNLQTEIDTLRNEKEGNEKYSSGASKVVPLTKQVSDLEKVITSMKRVVENLQNENNSLKKQIQTKGLAKISELQKENRKLRAEAEECIEETRKNLSQKQIEIDQLKKQTSKKADKVEKQLNTELESANSKLNAKDKQYSDTLKELNRKSTILLEVKKHLKIAADRESEIIREKQVLQEQIKFFENLTSGNQGLKKLGEKFQQARQEILDFENERESLVKNNAELKREIKGLKEVRLLDNEITNTAELQSLASENERLKSELNALDPNFFEEIEDLKFNYKKAIQQNILYEEHIAMVTTKFGVPPPEFSLSQL